MILTTILFVTETSMSSFSFGFSGDDIDLDVEDETQAQLPLPGSHSRGQEEAGNSASLGVEKVQRHGLDEMVCVTLYLF